MGGQPKGSKAERELQAKLWSQGFACMRAAGSGVTRFPSPDLLASDGNQVLAIECKTTKKDHQYFKPEQIEQLKEFAKAFDAKPLCAVRFTNEDWVFFHPDELEASGASFVVKRKTKGRLLMNLKET